MAVAHEPDRKREADAAAAAGDERLRHVVLPLATFV